MTGIEFLLFWVGWCLAGGSPGPATLSIAGTAMARGRSFGLAMSLGILVGSATWGLAAALGVSALMMAHAWVFEVIRYVGAAYLLFLAFKAMRSALKSGDAGAERAISGSHWAVFVKGTLIHLTNPKAILSWGAVYTLVALPGATTADLLIIFAYLYAGSILVFVGYAFLFSSPPMVAAYRNARRWFEGTFALFFGAASLRIFTVRLAE
ncbi:MAG: LysE family transporter [Pseudomonadota bacterium]